jgi:hypothetical protein
MADWCVQTGKVRYASRGEANDHLKRQRASRGNFRNRNRDLSGHSELKPFQCVTCAGWHLGHEPRSVKRVKRGWR